MENVDTPEPTPQALTAGKTLLKARKEAGLSRADIAHKTKVAERHIVAIEEDRFDDLAARTYAVGFSRAYARSLGLDEKLIADKVREQLDASEPSATPVQHSYEPGDPARIPSSGLAWLAAGAVVLIVGVVVYFWSSVFSPEGELPSLLAQDEPTQASAAAASPSAAVAVASGPVVLTSQADQLWLQVSDADGKTLVETVLKKGESWTVPEGANGPRLKTARPDALSISVGGKSVPALSDKPETVKNVSLTPRDLLGTQEALPEPSSRATASASAPTRTRTATSSPRPTASPSRTTAARPSAARSSQPAATPSARATPTFTSAPVVQSTGRASASATPSARPAASAPGSASPAPAPTRSPARATPSAAPAAVSTSSE